MFLSGLRAFRVVKGLNVFKRIKGFLGFLIGDKGLPRFLEDFCG